MIKLTIQIEGKFNTNIPFALKVCKSPRGSNNSSTANLSSTTDDRSIWETCGSKFLVMAAAAYFEDSEVWIVFPESGSLQRVFRPSSNSNTIMLTERCDQYCIMCSQPPKNKDYSYFSVYKDALTLIDQETIIGISGGEPMLFKDEFFDLVLHVIKRRPNISFHVLSNAQHFEESDLAKLSAIAHRTLWGIPLYSHNPQIHDEIVGKPSAFSNLMKSLNLLVRSASNVELRTVLLQQNCDQLPQLAEFISANLPWINVWSLMQLEPMGFAKAGWEKKFVDTSDYFELIGATLEICQAKRTPVRLFNFPTCTIPIAYRDFAVQSISDWKTRYLEVCSTCTSRKTCSGVFEWYSENYQFKNVGPEYL